MEYVVHGLGRVEGLIVEACYPGPCDGVWVCAALTLFMLNGAHPSLVSSFLR